MSYRKSVIIAGATGFVGRSLIEALRGEYHVIGLTRASPLPSDSDGVEWRRCDLFSLIQCEEAIHGADTAFYFVHSMLSSAHLTQGHFEDMDLILADNFARVASAAGISHMIYMGGIIPQGESCLSRHLCSRLEVEEILGARGVPVTTLRAGLIIGAESSSFRMLKAAVKNFTIIPCPKWVDSLTQPVAIEDVIKLLRFTLENPPARSVSFDIGAPDILTYRQLLQSLASHLKIRRKFISVPGRRWIEPWLSLLSGNPPALVGPLLESMRHSMVARDLRLQQEAGIIAIPLDKALDRALKPLKEKKKARRRTLSGNGYTVRSVQRIPLPEGKSALWLAEEYRVWLPNFFRCFFKAEADHEGNLTLRLRTLNLRLLQLTFDSNRSSSPDRQLFFITGGLLVRRTDRPSRRPRLEFRELLDGKCALVAIHDYRPTIPWPFYNLTQALAHIWVMRCFARHVRDFVDSRKNDDGYKKFS